MTTSLKLDEKRPTYESYTPNEIMTVVASRALSDDDVCFVGIGAPSAACNLARLTHAPNITLIYESGTIGTKPDILPLSIGDGELCDKATTTVSVAEMFRYWLQGGRITKGFLGAAQIDKFGNLNSTVIGQYDDPKVRLPGGGGAPEIALSCQEVFLTAAHKKRCFVDKLDFLTTLGFGDGGTDRAEHDIATKGPTQLITDLCLMEPDASTKELVVTSIYPGVTEQDIRNETGWDIRFAEKLKEIQAPTDEELEILRDLKLRTDRAHSGGLVDQHKRGARDG